MIRKVYKLKFLNMGNTSTTQNELNQTLNSIITDIMVKNSTSGQSDVSQTNQIVVRNSWFSNVFGLSQDNTAKIDLSLVSTTQQQTSMQTDIVNALTTQLASTSSVIGNASTNQNVQNVVTNAVKTNITQENITLLKASSAQLNSLIIDSSVATSLIKAAQSNHADVVMKMVNGTSQSIISALGLSTSSTAGATATTSNPISDIVSGLLGGPLIIIMIILAGCGFAYWKFNGVITSVLDTPTKKGIAAISIIVLVLLIWFGLSGSSKKSEFKPSMYHIAY